MIKLNDISKVFRTKDLETTAINNLSLTINEGDFVSIMGPSGCGKSTLLNILGLLDNPTKGSFYFNGTDVSNFSEKRLTDVRRGNVGFIFQNFNLIDELSVFENVELPLQYLKISKNERKERVMSILKNTGIDHRSGHYPRQLSGGQQQRVAISRALVTEPKFILADEPTGNLDSKNGKEVMNLLSELNEKGSTIIMVTHSNRDASYATKNVFLQDGNLVDKLVEEETL